ncbi:MAG: hypothetical protein H7Y18_00650 [Clostridiaceae bacterium]|nr:hypothetical protein [Clostridiaceae bacterium]
MSDETFVIKVPVEVKDQINNLIKEKSSITFNAFMQSLINIYVVEKTEERIIEIDEELKELDILKQRIDNIYINLDYRVEDITKTAEEKNQLFNKKNIVNIIINNLQQELLTLQESHESLLSKNNNIVQKNIEYFEKFNHLISCDIKIFNEAFKDKVNTIDRVLKQFDKYPQELETVKLLLSEAQSINSLKNNQIKKETNHLNIQIDDLEKYLSVIKVDQDKLICDLKDNFANQLRLSKDLSAEVHENALLKLRSEYENQAQNLQYKYNKLIEEYQKQAQISEELHNKITAQYLSQAQNLQDKYDKIIMGYQKQLETIQEIHSKEIEAHKNKYNNLLGELDLIKKVTTKFIMG